MTDLIESELEVGPPPRRVVFLNGYEAFTFVVGLVIMSVMSTFLLWISWTSHIALFSWLLNLPASPGTDELNFAVVQILFTDPIVAAFIFFYAGIPMTEWRIQTFGIAAKAAVTRITRMGSARDNPSFMVFYEFTPTDAPGRPQKVVQGRCIVQGEYGERMGIGQEITVLYLKNHPKWNHPCRSRRFRIVG
jgi:hypothetical protein